MHNPEFDSVPPDAATDSAADAAPAPGGGTAGVSVDAAVETAASPAPMQEASEVQAAEPSAEKEQATQAEPAVKELSPAQCSARLAELFPALFCLQQPLPLKLRIQADIQARAPGVFTRKTLSGFLHRYTTGTPYLLALTRQTQRFDLDGQAAGEVAAEHLGAATTELARRRAIVDARRAQERAAQREAQKEAPQQEQGEQPAKRPLQRPQHPQQPRPPRNPPQQRAKPAQREQRQPQQPRPARPAQEAAQHHEQAPLQPQQRERALLLRAFETSTLTQANFCALKGMTQADLEAQLALARSEAASRPQQRPPASPSSGQPSSRHLPRNDASRSGGRRPTR